MPAILGPTMPVNGTSEKVAFLQDVINGLTAQTKSLPCKYFYDARGSALFDAICELPEYYPTRTESAIMLANASEMAEALSETDMLIEYGSGSSTKTRILLDRLSNLKTYVPVDISHEHLHATANELRFRYPQLCVEPVSADYTKSFTLPNSEILDEQRSIYFPGSTIGNFHPAEATTMLKHMAEICKAGGNLLIGTDLQKDLAVLESAYNDSSGITAEFNRNVLVRINEELEGDIPLDRFDHRAYFNSEHGRIEMHLICTADLEVWIGNKMILFQKGESIWTESSYKYTTSGFEQLAHNSGWSVRKVWTDPNNWFSVQLLQPV